MGHSSISTAGASFFSKRKEDAGTRLPPVEGCGTYTRLLPIRILYLPRRSLAMPRTSHLTANTIHHRRTPEATAIPHRDSYHPAPQAMPTLSRQTWCRPSGERGPCCPCCHGRCRRRCHLHSRSRSRPRREVACTVCVCMPIS